MLRWLIGVPLALVSGLGTVLVLRFQIQLGWDRDGSLLGVVFAWVLVGSLLFLKRREAGRRVLRGASIAFALFLTMLILMQPFGAALPRVHCTLGVAVCVLLVVALSLRSVKAAMREAGNVS